MIKLWLSMLEMLIFVGCNIPGAINVSNKVFLDHVDDLANLYKNYDRVIIHCMFSQVRGPYCASLFSNALEKIDHNVKVSILDGGYDGWKKYIIS